jgi:hypothetical protein
MKKIANKIIFLDIDGVLKPPRTDVDIKWDAIEEMILLLAEKHGRDYSQYDFYDVTNVYFGWDKEALHELRRIVAETDAMIVISSSWKQDFSLECMIDFFRIHDLGERILGYTPYLLDNDATMQFMCSLKVNMWRSAEILAWLHFHPKISSWVAIDDMPLGADLGENAIRTRFKLTQADADTCIYILNKKT